jgi:hypothetical protein
LLFFYERAIGLSLAIAKDVRSGRVRENLILVGVRCLLAIAKKGCLRESLTLLGVRRLLAVPKEVPSLMSEEGKLAGPPLRREGNLAGCAQRSPLHMSEEGKAGSDRRRGERASCGFAIMGLASCCCSRVEGTARLRFCCGRLSFCSSHPTQSRSLRCLFLCLETCISLPFPLIPLQP